MTNEDIPGYRAVHWEPTDLISQETMERVNSNIQAIHDYTPRTLFSEPKISTTKNIKIASGRHLIPQQKGNEVAVKIRFPTFFSPNCQPNITTGINARMQQNIYCTFSGNEGAGLTPNNDGFTLHVQIAKEDGEKKKIARNIWIHWMAMGY